MQALDKMQREWEHAELLVLEYRETKTYIIKARPRGWPRGACVKGVCACRSA